jgi:CBS domain-containing protein
MLIREIMTRNPETIRSDATLKEAAGKMRDLDVGVLPVARGNEIVGVITDRDLVTRALAENEDPRKTKVRQIMTSEVYWCGEDDTLEEAARLFEDKKVHRLLVMNSEHQPSGIITLADLACKGQNEHLAYEVLERICEPARPHR